MYEGFYKLKEAPFGLSPDPAFMCMTSQHQEALSGLIYRVCTRAGLTVLIGEAGTGKTTLLHYLLALLESRRFSTAMCVNPTLTRAEFYDFLMLKFRVDCPSALKSRQLAALENHLLRNRADGRPSILIVDEAQRLSPELLEEVRLLLNLETPREKLLEIVISGQPELGEMLNRPDLRQLKQRISTICRLKPLTLEQLHEYLHHRLSRAGLPNQTLFPNESIELIFRHTQGIPRLVNSLCDSALQTGFAIQAARITPAVVEEAATDLDLSSPFELKEMRTASDHYIPDSSAISVPTLHLATGTHGRNGNTAPEAGLPPENGARQPLENYDDRQKSANFLANLIHRWR